MLLKTLHSSFKKRFAMSQIYSSYLANFNTTEVRAFMIILLDDELLVDWQDVDFAALLQAKKGDDICTKVAVSILKNGDCHEVLRGVAAVYIGKDLGNHRKRRSFKHTPRCLLTFSLPFTFRRVLGRELNAQMQKQVGGSHSPVNLLITAALAKK